MDEHVFLYGIIKILLYNLMLNVIIIFNLINYFYYKLYLIKY
jgi:hypothetical protein